jgi:inner membrane protein involved in colicin E2 resistance
MALWQKLWLLFAVIWVVVAGLNAATILAFSEPEGFEKAFLPAAMAIVVPAAAYLLAWLWNRWRGAKR